MPHVAHTLRLASRSLRRRPGFSLVVVLVLGVAIGGNAAMFSIVDATLLDPLPFASPGELVTVDVISTKGYSISTSIPNYRDWRDRGRVFADWGATSGWDLIRTGDGPAEAVSARAVYGDLFAVLGLLPAHGRTFDAAETEPGAESVVVLGHDYWQRRFGGDPGAVGRALTLDGRPYVVVGVLRPGDGYPSHKAEAYFPMGSLPDLPWDNRDSAFGTRAVARLAPGATVEAAAADLARIHRELEGELGMPIDRPEARTLEDLYVGDSKRRLWLLMGAIACVLLIAVANVVGLFLVRSEDRRGERAVHRALGAGRLALAAPVLAEGALLALAGGVAGLGLAALLVEVGRPALTRDLPVALVERVAIDMEVALFTFAITAVAALAAGLTPVLVRHRVDLAAGLRERSAAGGAGRGRLRSTLVVAQIAASVVLLVGAGLLLASLDALRHVDLGFTPENVLAARVGIPESRNADEEGWRAFYARVEEEAARLPGVESAALSLLVPLQPRSWELALFPEGVDFHDGELSRSVLFNVVSEGYFETLDVPLLRGRTFDSGDREGTLPVAIVDETMAAELWPGQDTLGKRIFLEEHDEDGGALLRTIVGIVPNLRHYTVAEPSRIQVYLPFRQSHQRWGMSLNLLARTGPPPEALAEPLRAAVTRLDADAPLMAVAPLTEVVDEALAGNRAIGTLLGAFAVLALALAALGLFGLLSSFVVRRLRDIGIRMAVGANRRSILAWLSRRVLGVTLAGVGLGLVAAAAGSRLLEGFLFEVEPLSPLHYLGAATVMALVAAAAALLPARRATSVDPTQVLRAEG
ncbi:MAG TPA: ADOP family duplicated permease [Thermoanaerobaculia bacterium]|nr:ADOP family duplicated permease [Thermoanaerobaculia bacterium]